MQAMVQEGVGERPVFVQPAYEVSRRLCFQRFCPSVHRGGGVGGRGGGVKIEKCSECHGKPKKYIYNRGL